MCLHDVLAPLYDVGGVKRITQDKFDMGKGKAKDSSSLATRIRQIPLGKYSMIQPVIREFPGLV
jgi:hypothetical protein